VIEVTARLDGGNVKDDQKTGLRDEFKQNVHRTTPDKAVPGKNVGWTVRGTNQWLVPAPEASPRVDSDDSDEP
jgi:hypothetical protein